MTNPLQLSISLDAIRHLGLNLYDSLPPVLSELVANAYDARARRVDIHLTTNEVTISDDGIGMSREDMQRKYLVVGRDRRREVSTSSDLFPAWPVRAKPMGRKGIGKLAMFSIAGNITVYSRQGTSGVGIKMQRADVEQAAKSNSTYKPEEVAPPNDMAGGTRIVLSNLDRKKAISEERVRKALSRRFSVIDDAGEKGNEFSIYVNGNQVTAADWDILSKLQAVWLVGKGGRAGTKCRPDTIQGTFSGTLKVGETEVQVDGWIGTVKKPSQLKAIVDGSPINDNRLTVDCRGKVAISNFLHQYGESGNYASYLCGYIRADYLDDSDDDIATSDRDRMREDDERVIILRDHIRSCLKKIQEAWSDLRATKSEENAAVSKWIASLRPDEHAEARKLLARIAGSKFDDAGDEAQLLKYAILAYERLRVRRQELGDLNADPRESVARMLALESDLENALYADIAMQRLSVVRKLTNLVDNDVKERVIQEHVFTHMWLLEPSWTAQDHIGSHLEERVTTEFGRVKLLPAEELARPDIRYRKSGGIHIIVELKRPSVNVEFFDLMGQVDKYKSALRKCLLQVEGESNPAIQVVCLLGHQMEGDPEKDRIMHGANVKIMTYDRMISETLKRFDDFVQASKELGRIQKLLADLDSQNGTL